MNRFTPERIPIVSLKHLSRDYHALRLGPWRNVKQCRPGQFVHLGLPQCDVYFRRAMSIASVNADTKELEIIFKVFGRGTRALSQHHVGDILDVLGPLGKPFRAPRKSETCIMVGGGVGFPPLFFLAKWLVEQGFSPKSIEFFYGGRTSGEIVERSRIKKLGVNFHPVTDDGSLGVKGLVTEAVETYLAEHKLRHPRLYACGPGAMLKATDDLGQRLALPGQVSLEAPMPCGFGVCLGCVVPLRAGGHARVCHEGPVFEIGEVLL